MKRRLAALAISLVAIAGLLHTSVQPASACACMPGPDLGNMQNTFDHAYLIVEGHLAPSERGDPAWSRRFDVDTVYDGDSPPQIVLAMREPNVLDPAFDPAGYLDMTAPDCTYIILGQTGDRYVLFLKPDSTGAYEPLGCDSFAIQNETRDSYFRDLHSAIQTAAAEHPPDAAIVNPTVAPVLPIIPAKGTPIPNSNSRPPSEYLRATTAEPTSVVDAVPAVQVPGDKDPPVYILLPLAFLVPIGVLLGFSFFVRRRGGGH